ncbi:DUF86 domain-containing protein [Allokutzneria sp. NRRL B-24872]|uniref:HepT-like ribonuclease domain-containing protein n=1 Tax=Allokutzneria sp. NRRL B-24872 TaxID=1137961 RepID=UPI000A36E173|nr:DUF86 domain-containing protein [Allokutzneria sp. NRRL B-24872]
MKRDSDERLRDILDAADAIARNLPGSHAALERDEVRQAALLRWIGVIGEAANHVSTDVHAAYPAVPWRSIVGMRNRTVHAYFEVDLDVLWKVASEELPRVRTQIEAILRERPQH